MSTAEGGGNIVTDGLVLCLDAANSKSIVSGSTTWTDLSRSGNNGTLVNGPTFNSGNGGSIVFDGTNNYCVTNLAFSNAITVITVGKSTTPTWSNYAGLGSARSSNGYIIHSDQGNTLVTFYIVNQTGVYYNIGQILVPNIQTPNFYAISTNGSNIHKAYLNGVLQITNISTTVSRTDTPTNINNILGADDYPSRYTACSIYSHLVYSRQLSDIEILQNYNATKTRFGL